MRFLQESYETETPFIRIAIIRAPQVRRLLPFPFTSKKIESYASFRVFLHPFRVLVFHDRVSYASDHYREHTEIGSVISGE